MSRWSTILSIPFCIFIGWTTLGLQRLEISDDSRIFFPSDHPELQKLDAFETNYSKDNNIFIVVAPKNESIFSPSGLALLKTITDEAWQTPYCRRVDSITNFQHTTVEEDDLTIKDLVLDASSLDVVAINHIEQIVLSEPTLVNRLISADGRVTGINITLNLPNESKEKAPQTAVLFVRSLLQQFEKSHPDVTFFLSGLSTMDYALLEMTQADGEILFPLMLIIMTLMLGICLRRLSSVIIVLMLVFLSSLTAFGLAGWMNITLSFVTLQAPLIIMTLAVADGVHIIHSFYNYLGQGFNKRQAIKASLKSNTRPMVLTSLTTGLGFLSLNFNASPVFKDLGNITAIGVIVALILSLSVLPGLLRLLPKRSTQTSASLQKNSLMESFAHKTIKYRCWTIIIVSIVILFSLIYIPRNQFNDNHMEYFHQSLPVRQAADFTIQHLGGIFPIEYSLESNSPQGINDPAYLKEVEAFADWYRQQTDVGHVSSIVDTLKRLNQDMHGDDKSYYRIPESKALAAQYLLLYEMSLPYGLSLNDQINIDRSATRMQVTLKALSTQGCLNHLKRAQEWLNQNGSGKMTAVATGEVVVASWVTDDNIKTMFWGTLIILGVISVILLFVFGFSKIGLTSIVVNFLPAIIVFGFWGAIDGEISLLVSTIAAMTLGIIVDDTIYFLTYYLNFRKKQNHTPEEAIRKTLLSVGKALSTTSIVLVCGFLVLTFSHFTINISFGLLTALIILIALAVDFFLLPVLLYYIDRKKEAPC